MHLRIYFLQGKIKAASLSMSHTSLQLPAVGSTDKMIHLLLTDTFFATVITASIHSGLLHHKILPDQVNLYTVTVIEQSKYAIGLSVLSQNLEKLAFTCIVIVTLLCNLYFYLILYTYLHNYI